jgi:glucokinase
MTQSSYIGALDIGGTKILAGIIDPAGELAARRRIATRAERGAEDIVASAAALMQELMLEAGIERGMLAGIGCSVPGPLDRERGVVLFSPNLAWRDVPLAKLLRDSLSVSVEIEDDARCAALGEARRGAARGAQIAVYVTISTGIGSGVIVNGRLYRGAHGLAGEIGHITLDPFGPSCSCGNTGCFESLASGMAIAARARQAIMQGDATVIADFGEESMTAERVIQAAEAGDEVARRIVETAGDYIGIGLAAVASAFDPEMIVLGGGVMTSRASDERCQGLLWQRARAAFAARAIPPLGTVVQIVPAMLADASALWGAAALIGEKVGVADV